MHPHYGIMAALGCQLVPAAAEPVVQVKRPRVMRLVAHHAFPQRRRFQPRELVLLAARGSEAGVPRDPVVGKAADGGAGWTPRLDKLPGAKERGATVLDELGQGVGLKAAVAQLLAEDPSGGGLGGPGVGFGEGDDGGGVGERGGVIRRRGRTGGGPDVIQRLDVRVVLVVMGRVQGSAGQDPKFRRRVYIRGRGCPGLGSSGGGGGGDGSGTAWLGRRRLAGEGGEDGEGMPEVAIWGIGRVSRLFTQEGGEDAARMPEGVRWGIGRARRPGMKCITTPFDTVTTPPHTVT